MAGGFRTRRMSPLGVEFPPRDAPDGVLVADDELREAISICEDEAQ